MNAPSSVASGAGVDRIAVRIERRRVVLAFADIRWIVAQNAHSVIHTVAGAQVVRHPLRWLAGALPPDRFVRINRSVLVNLACVREFRPKSHGDGLIVVDGGTELVLSRSRRRQVLAVLAPDDQS